MQEILTSSFSLCDSEHKLRTPEGPFSERTVLSQIFLTLLLSRNVPQTNGGAALARGTPDGRGLSPAALALFFLATFAFISLASFLLCHAVGSGLRVSKPF